MVDLRKNMIVIDGQIKTGTVHSCRYNPDGRRVDIVYSKNPRKTFSYSRSKVTLLTEPVEFKPEHCHIYHGNRLLYPLAYIAVFRHQRQKYWYVEYPNGAHASYDGAEIKCVQSCLEDKQSVDVFSYLREVSKVNQLKDEDGVALLYHQYTGIDFIGDDRAVAPYLNPKEFEPLKFRARPLIYPFGCNASQQKAVQTAFENQTSIVQGPPGTGKTQTILNIIANILVQDKTVMVVSNNNSAIANVLEKLERNGLGFVAAMLGSSANKEAFLEAQESDKIIPEQIDEWHTDAADSVEYLKEIGRQSAAMAEVFAKQERLALAKQETDALAVEKTHFEQEVTADGSVALRRDLSSAKLLELWNELETNAENRVSANIFARLVLPIKKYLFKRKIRRLFKGIGQSLQPQDYAALIPVVQRQFYIAKERELAAEIESLNRQLSTINAPKMMERLSGDSMCYLRNVLYHRYGKEHERQIFRNFTPEFVKEYPVILSTAFSSRTNFKSDVLFDYVIMDEASQISAETGSLALMCAKNAVIVGDSMQLPNVVTEEDALRLQAIAADFAIDDRYDCAKHSFLESVCRVLPDAPQTLLREHYRCHPKIINFCNQKFYGGRLVIMTEDRGEKDVIVAHRTVAGDHSRGKYNQREIDAITQELLPTMPYDALEIGIIAPYNAQVDELNRALGGKIEVATVHKFQGREKDAILMSVVDDTVTEFSDDPNLLNVAISRAKNRFCLVVSGNEQPKDCNIADLLGYIEYNNCTVSQSRICSVFDLLYEQYAEARRTYLQAHKRISEYDSENLTYALLEDLLAGNPRYRHLGIVCHQPLRQLLRDMSVLDEEERRYASNAVTHIDFLIYNRVSKQPVLAIETDGYWHHKSGTKQSERDERKNRILARYGLPLLRLSTTGHDERKQVEEALSAALQ